jgi:hypothetical protein
MRSQALNKDWCRRWDLNPETASTPSQPGHSVTDSKDCSDSAQVDGEDLSDLAQGQKRDSGA